MSGADNRCTWVNKRWLDFTGRTLEDELGDGWSHGVHAEDLDHCLETYISHFDARSSFTMEYRLRRNDGEYRWVLDIGIPLLGPGGEFSGYIGSCIDITQRKRAEEALRASESRLVAEAEALARLYEASSRLWQVPSLREGLEEMLAATIELLGTDMGTIQLLDASRGGLTIEAQRGFAQDFLDSFRDVSAEDDLVCGRALRSGERLVIEDVETDPPYAPYREIARAAGYRGVQSTPLIGRGGKPLGIISTYFRIPHAPDEQDLRRLDLYAQAADFIELQNRRSVLRSEERFRALSGATWDVVYCMSPDWAELRHLEGRGSSLTRRYRAANGWTKYIPSDDHKFVMETIQQAIRTKSVFELEHRVIRVDGTLGWTHLRTIPILNAQGEIVEWLAPPRM